MEKHSENLRNKTKDNEQKRHIQAKKSGLSQENTSQQESDGLTLNTPFIPRVNEHIEMLAGMKFSVQKKEFIMRLNESYGSQYVQRLLTSVNARAKLNISSPEDACEKEADHAADQVMKTLNSGLQKDTDDEELQAKLLRSIEEDEDLLQGKLLRSSPEEEELLQGKLLNPEEDEEELQMQSSDTRRSEIANPIESSINAARGGGQSLPETIRTDMENSFGADFSQVRIHTDTEADRLNHQINARAFTTERDIFFRENEFNPSSSEGKHLIAHELTHVVQQNGGQLKRNSQTVSMMIQRDWAPSPEDMKIISQIPNRSTLDIYDLKNYLRNDGLYRMLESYAQSEFSAENMHFLKDMISYGGSAEYAEKIWDTYLREGAPEPINISNGARNTLRLAYAAKRHQARVDFEKKTGESGADMRCPVCSALVLDSGHIPARTAFSGAEKDVITNAGDTLARFKDKLEHYLPNQKR